MFDDKEVHADFGVHIISPKLLNCVIGGDNIRESNHCTIKRCKVRIAQTEKELLDRPFLLKYLSIHVTRWFGTKKPTLEAS